MYPNLGSLDRTVRILIGIAVLAFVWIGPKTPWAILGLIPLVEGLVGYCPLFALFRISSCGTFHRTPKHA